MRWCYTNDIRDDFGKGVHRDILIVPHGTKVEKNPGGAPILTNKRPHFIWDPNGGKDHNGQYVPERKNGQIIYDEVDWAITNEDIIKEKFKYSHSLNSDDNLTFSSCNAAMIQFTIRNKKEFIHDIDPVTGEELDTGYWEQEIPNLQNYEYVEKDPNGNTRKIVGEIVSDYCIEAFMYFNGDSDTLMYLGMFKVDEDKLVDDGYNRQITACDFLAWFRELDIFKWYKHLFEGINKLQSDYDDMTNEKDEEEKEKPKGWDESWVREPKEKWTIKEALEDIINNLAAYDMITWLEDETEIDPDTGEPVKKPQVGNTTSNPSPYGRDDYGEGNGYTGLGMPIMIDQDILTKGSKPYTPKEPGEGEYERYGYMDILDLEFYQDPKIMKNESLSMGKFLQDIGILAGRYPYIRSDRFEDGYYVDPEDHTYGEFDNRYQNYERCILTFKPLPSAEDDEDSKGNTNLQPEQQFDNSEIVKGFQHDYYQVESMLVIQIGFDDGNVIKYQKLTKDQKNAAKINALQTYSFSDNMFCSYLVSKSDNDTIKEMLPKYKTIREKLFGTETGNDNISSDALFQQAYKNIRNRIYTPCQLQTYADPVREVGDRILVNFTDAITGEKSRFYTYILEREMNGIQKMMDTYTAKGSMKNPTFSNYQSSSKSKTNNGNQNGGNSTTSIMTPSDLVEYMRNCGYRLLDEPSDCSAVFVRGVKKEVDPGPQPDPEYEALYSQINEWHIIHTPNWSIIVPNVWVASTQNDYTGRYFIWDVNSRKNHSYYRNNSTPDQWAIKVTNQDAYAINDVITININKNSNDKYVVTLPTLTWSNDVFKNSYQYPGSKYYGWRMDYNGGVLRAVGWYASSEPSIVNPSIYDTSA